jgi:hypothetical protein
MLANVRYAILSLLVQRSAVALHRRFSSLLFDPAETFSSCPTTSYNDTLRASPASATFHTTWCTRAASAQIRLFAQPTAPNMHTPFTACMLVNAIISLVAACKYGLVASSARMTREEIRLGIGCLRSFAMVWPRAERTLGEVQAIAREMLLQPA